MKTKSFKRSLTHLISIMALAWLMACGSFGDTKNGGAAASSAGSSTDPKTTVLRAFQQLSTKSYRLRETTTMSGPGGQMTAPRVMEFVPPNRFHAILDSYETISIGDAHFQKLNGQWSKGAAAGRRGSNQAGSQIRQAIESGALVVSFVGSDSVDGKPARLYQIAGSMKFGDKDLKGEYKVWLSAAEDWPLKVIAKSEAPYNMESVLTYEQDPSIRIEAPVP